MYNYTMKAKEITRKINLVDQHLKNDEDPSDCTMQRHGTIIGMCHAVGTMMDAAILELDEFLLDYED